MEISGDAIEDGSESDAPPSEPPLLDFTTTPEVVASLVEGERLSFGHLENPAFATETSNIDPLPHQRIAVYDHMLSQPRLRFLLADDAGAGKTIMTGLYTREMLSRRLLRRVLIVPPAGLVGNWQREMQVLFNLPFTVVAGSDAKSANPFVGGDSNRVIVSVDTLAGERVFARLREASVEPYDLVVFDEAHKLSVDRGSDLRVRKTDRYKLAEALAGVRGLDPGWQLHWASHHLLLLTATPHQGKDYPYYGLWRLLEPDVLSTPEAFENALCRRANEDDPQAKQQLARILQQHPEVWQTVTDLHRHAIDLLWMRLAEGEALIRESLDLKIEQERRALGFSSASLLERMMIEQVLLCWAHVMCRQLLRPAHDAPRAQQLAFERRLRSAQARQAAAVKNLAELRSLLAAARPASPPNDLNV